MDLIYPVNDIQWLGPDQPPLFTLKRKIHVKKVMMCVWWAKQKSDIHLNYYFLFRNIKSLFREKN